MITEDLNAIRLRRQRPRAMSARDEIDFEEAIEGALESLPANLREFMSNVAIVVEQEPPAGRPLLGLYEGFPLTRRGSAYAGFLRTRSRSFSGRSSDSPAAILLACAARFGGSSSTRSPTI
jgi:hypothetical protein